MAVGVGAPEVLQVIAFVDLEERRPRPAGSDPIGGLEFLASSEFLRLSVSLSADLCNGRRIETGRRNFGIGGPRRGVGAIWHRYHGPPLAEDAEEQGELLNQTYRVGRCDVQDAVNEMLGRDPMLHRPPRLAWGYLIAALAGVGTNVSEQALIEVPLVMEFASRVESELEGQ